MVTKPIFVSTSYISSKEVTRPFYGPCTYGKLETEEGSGSLKTIPSLRNVMFPQNFRFETVDLAVRLLIPIIVPQNHNRYNIMEKGHNYTIDIASIEKHVKNMVHKGEEVVIVGGSHLLHLHEKLAIVDSIAMCGHSL